MVNFNDQVLPQYTILFYLKTSYEINNTPPEKANQNFLGRLAKTSCYN